MNLSTEKIAPGKKADPESSPVRKFMFDVSFDAADVVHRAAERKPVLMKQEQIDALKKESYDAGFAAGQQALQTAQARDLTAVLGKVDQNIAALMQNIGDLVSEHEELMRRLALAAIKKVLPAFTAQNGTQEIEALINETIREWAREPRLVVRVSESDYDALNERIQEIATQRAYSGKVIVLADAEVASGNCRIEWPDGGVERNVQATVSAVEQTILPT
jgi:flagellar assembly protein FliH